MEHKIRQQRWISYSIALLLAFTLSWGLTQPAQAAEEATQIGVNLSQGDPITGLTVTFRVQSNGGTEPITGSIIVQGSWGESCTKTLTAADNLPVPIGHMAGSTCQMSPPLGIYTITVTYGGDAFYAPSSRQNIEIISKYFADLVITTHTPNPSSIDQAVLVQYSVTAVRSLPFSPTGTVFVTDGVNSCISTPATGQCSLILETSGTRTLSASYSGDATFRGDSASVSHTVNGYATTTTITADSPDPSTQGQTVSVSYSVVANDPSKGTPSGNVTVSDGVASCTGTVAAGSCSLTLNTAGARTLTATYAGNSKFAGSISAGEPHTVNAPDTTPPVITASGTKADGSPYTPGTWTNQNVLVRFTCSDTGSGIATCPGDQLLSLDGTFTAEGTATDNAGNSATVSFGPIQIDKTAPTISAAATAAPNGNGWYNSNVTIHFTCADNLAGVTSCPADEILSSEGSAVSSTAQTISDIAGNSSAASNVVTVPIDKTAPVVTVTGVSAGGSYPLGSVPTAGCSTTDALSGVATQATLSITGGGGPLGADGTGSFTATCSGATDNAGNSGSASATYGVTYNWSGFLQPVDNLPVVNTVNAGTGIPVKFSLGGDYGLNILAAGYPKVQTVACGSGSGGSSNPIEETVTAGSSSLQYDPTTQTYIYVWKTDKAWAGACRQLIVRLIDGTDHIALFQFNGKVRSANGGESTPDEGEQTIETVNDALPRAFLPLVNR